MYVCVSQAQGLGAELSAKSVLALKPLDKGVNQFLVDSLYCSSRSNDNSLTVVFRDEKIDLRRVS
jgi:hypothetical protein